MVMVLPLFVSDSQIEITHHDKSRVIGRLFTWFRWGEIQTITRHECQQGNEITTLESEGSIEGTRIAGCLKPRNFAVELRR